jgi:type IV secretion system protein VirB2
VELVVQQSLLASPGASPLVTTTRWIDGVLLGEVALGVGVLAVAIIGAHMLTGKLPLRQGVRVVIGCFVLLGAPVISAAFTDLMDSDMRGTQPEIPTIAELAPTRPEPPPVQYNPYAQASVRDDR